MKCQVCILLAIAIACVWGISPPTVTMMKPQGLRFSYPDSSGISLVSFHYSINKPVSGVAAGDYNADINAKTGNEWVLENSNINLQPGDEVHFWVNVIKDGQGNLLKDQVWIVAAPTTITSTPTTARLATKVETVRPIVNTQAPNINQFQPNGPSHSHADSNMQSYYGQKSGSSAGQSADSLSGTQTGSGSTVTGTSTIFVSLAIQILGTSSTSSSETCGCVGNSVRPPGSEKTCVQFPCLIFDDEFDTLNLDVWEHEITASGGGTMEFEYYTNNRTNSYVKDGKLFIKPTLTVETLNVGPEGLMKGSLDVWGSQPGDVCTGNWDMGCKRDGTPDHIINPIQSARIRSSRGFNFKYGQVEIRAKMPKGDWLWPAIWMLPLRNSYGRWPASGEIDIVESRGNGDLYRDNQGNPRGNNVVSSTLHYGTDYWHHKWIQTHGKRVSSTGSYADGFHNYTLIWDADFIKIYIDGDEVLNVTPQTNMWEYSGSDKEGVDNPWRGGAKMAPFDQEFFLIMNVAVGGVDFFPDSFTYTPGKPWKNKSNFAARDFWNARRQWYPTWNPDQNNGEDAALQVDYIKVWKLRP